jgi:hypothetical protein
MEHKWSMVVVGEAISQALGYLAVRCYSSVHRMVASTEVQADQLDTGKYV